MSNWAENPEHFRDSLLNASLPRILFQDCYRYCVNSQDYFNVQSQSEQACILNCQSKTSRAFDLYMATSVRFAAKKDWRSQIEVSRFTGMEVEHSHDTASVISHANDLHVTLS